jgi:hypothetical protein
LRRFDDALKYGVEILAANSDTRAQLGKNLLRLPFRSESRQFMLGDYLKVCSV